MRVYTKEAADAFKKTGNFENAMDCLLEGTQHYADCISRAIIMPRPDLMLAAAALTNILDMVMDSLDDVEKETLEHMKKMLGVNAVTIVPPTYNPAWLNAEDFNIPKTGKDTNVPTKEETAMEKLPINKNIPLDTEDGYDAHGEPVWAWLKKGKWLYIFDKFWRKIPTESSDYGAEFASEEARAEAWPVTDMERVTIIEDVTDPNEYDEDGNVIGKDVPEEDEEENSPEKPNGSEPTQGETAKPVNKCWAPICRVIAEAFEKIAKILE